MKYQLQESKDPGWWVVTDTQEHKFNETQMVNKQRKMRK